jgi:4-hydroxythreonine-4-phosphate dehydrogenase
MSLPLLALTLGDPAGIGPEVVLKALLHPEILQICRPVVLGDRRILERAAQAIKQPLPRFTTLDSELFSELDEGKIGLVDLQNADPQQIPFGLSCAAGGRAAVEYVLLGCDLALANKIGGVVTAPLNKSAMHLAGYNFPGHTELLAARCKSGKVSMLLVGPQLRVVHVSTHVSLPQAVELVRRERILDVIGLAHRSCRALGIHQPRIAVAGLNPHAGEGGLFGDHEEREIQPAIEEARKRGLHVSDPQPPDTVFLRAVKGHYDIVVAMYHDQGHIPMKLLAFDSGVNVSIGLPIIRTSVDHGTAFDIAGQGIASENSMCEAIKVAAQMAKAKQAGHTA